MINNEYKKAEEILRNGLEELQISINEAQIKKIIHYMDLLLETNKLFNLTAITDPTEVIYKHFLDSLAVLPFLENIKNARIIDIGTGPGFPGIPIKIYRDGDKLTLVDCVNKKVNFLKNVTEELELKNIECTHVRAEDLARTKEHRESYDIVISRALASLNLLVELCLPFAKVGGLFIAYKSKETDQEVKIAEKAIKLMGGKITDIKKIVIPGLNEERNLIFIKKINKTPTTYPRKSGTPQKKPIV